MARVLHANFHRGLSVTDDFSYETLSSEGNELVAMKGELRGGEFSWNYIRNEVKYEEKGKENEGTWKKIDRDAHAGIWSIEPSTLQKILNHLFRDLLEVRKAAMKYGKSVKLCVKLRRREKNNEQDYLDESIYSKYNKEINDEETSLMIQGRSGAGQWSDSPAWPQEALEAPAPLQ